MADDKQPDRRGAGAGAIGFGRGYGRDFGGGGRNQGFDGSWGQGYGGSVGPSDYREGFGGEAYGGGMSGADYERSFGGRGEDFGGDDRTWMDARADAETPEEGPHRGRGPQGWKRTDDRLRETVCEALSEDPMLDARDIDVEVAEGVVTLSGSVPEATDTALAGLLARRCPGVTRVENRLHVAPDYSQPDFSPDGSDHALTSSERFAAMRDSGKRDN